MNIKKKKLLAVASGGGHLIQLLRLRPAMDGCDVTFVSTLRPAGLDVDSRFYKVMDANLDSKWKLLPLLLQVFVVFLKVRPQVVITTGAAPGFAALMVGRLFGAKTIWIDSIANSEELSTAGKRARPWADVWLTQWPHLSSEDGPQFWGGVL